MRPTAPRRSSIVIGLALVVLLGASACGSEGPASVGSGAGSIAGVPTQALLDGRTFLSQSVTESGVARPLALGGPITLTFEGDVVRADAGCNTSGGHFTLDGDRFSVGVLDSTAMACEGAGLMDQDTWFGSLLTAGGTLALDGDQLTMTSGDTVIVLLDREAADPDRPLVGTTWTLETILDGQTQTASSVPAGVTATLSIPDSGTISWTACNTSSGRLESIEASTLTIGQVSSTLKGCSEASGKVDAAMAAVLSGTVSYQIEGPVLHVRNGSSGLDFRAG